VSVFDVRKPTAPLDAGEIFTKEAVGQAFVSDRFLVADVPRDGLGTGEVTKLCK
jgi:hypothetical protein